MKLEDLAKRLYIPTIEKGDKRIKYSGLISYSLIDQNKITIQTKLPSFILKNNNMKYFFRGTDILIQIQERGNLGKISKPITNPNYRHPFVYSNGNICFNDKDSDFQWKTSSISFRYLDHKTIDFAEMLKRTVIHTHKVLTAGYFGKINPITKLNEENFPEEFNRGRVYA